MLHDHHTAPVTDAERGMLDYAVKLTRSPQTMQRADVDVLRDLGFDDGAISQIVQVTALFNYYNRIADGLGIDNEADW